MLVHCRGKGRLRTHERGRTAHRTAGGRPAPRTCASAAREAPRPTPPRSRPRGRALPAGPGRPRGRAACRGGADVAGRAPPPPGSPGRAEAAVWGRETARGPPERPFLHSVPLSVSDRNPIHRAVDSAARRQRTSRPVTEPPRCARRPSGPARRGGRHSTAVLVSALLSRAPGSLSPLPP